jgi:AraC-like DNA-binding protein
MDTVSQMLQATRARSLLIADMRLGGNLSIGVPAFGGIPFHYVAQGDCRLETGMESVVLRAGDFVMLTRLPYYRIQTGSGSKRVEVMDFAERDGFSIDDLRTGLDHLLIRDIGDPPMQVRMFSAIIMPCDGPAAGALTRELPTVMILRDMKSLLEPWLAAAIAFMSADGHDSEPGLSVMAERLIELIFVSVLRKWLLHAGHERGWMRGLTDPAISRVLNAMHTQPGRRWTLSDLSVVAGRSRSGIAKHFRDVMHETPFTYLTRWRMRLAAKALAGGDRSSADIGANLGYQSALTFSRAFHSTFGVTPAQYRRRHVAASVG